MINSLLSQVELQTMLVEWNRTATDYPRHLCIHQVFEMQVAQTPEAVAVIFEGLQMTYGELNRRANQLAYRLRSLGVGPEILVGISVERSVDMIVGLLGILKAGGAYLPLNPTYPPARLRWLLEDAQVSVLLTQAKFMELVQSLNDNVLTSVVCLDTDRETIDHESKANLVNQTSPENLAYVMYTSGSTGQPKGVSVVHRGVVRLVKNTNYLKFSADQVFLQLSTIVFDASTFEIWGALLNGAKLVLLPPQMLSLVELGQALRRYQVTTLLITTGLFHQMIDERLEDLHGLRYLMTGGEVLSPRHAKKVLENLKKCQFINAYGPTENTTITTCGLINDLNQIGDTVPIGRPITNTQVYVLNAQMQPVPAGVDGELYIGGDGLARGYFKRPELTVEKFVPNPFSEDPKARLYKTGDLVRYLPDGQLDFRGRVDYQVKLRGFRIEPGEIEATLQQFPVVRQALVMMREVSPQDKRLVAYVVLTEEARQQVAETIQVLRDWLGVRLPKYMLPAAIVPLAEFPVTLQGKVDRQALPMPGWSTLRELAEEDLPHTVTEQQLLMLWSSVLNVAPLSIHDNFFAVGGHSLLVTQLVARIRETFQVDLPLRSLFNYPTVSTLAGHLEQNFAGLPAKASTPADSEWPAKAISPATSTGVETLAGLSVYQAGWWLFEQIHPATPTYHIALAFEVKGRLNIAVLEQALTELAHRHTVLRTCFATDEAGQPQQRLAVPSPCPVTVIDRRHLPATDILAILKTEARRPFELVKDRLWRVAVYHLEEQRQVLLLTFHHLIIDGWSMGLFFQELTELYAALEAGRPSPLPAPAYQYVDFCHWQQQWLQGEEFRAQLAYWQARLLPLPPVLELPSDYPRPPVQTYEGARQPIAISPTLTVAIRTLGHQQGVTLFMVLLAAFQVLLYRYTGQTDISVGTAVAGRQRVVWEKVIGLFINNLVLRTDLSQQPSVVSLLQQVREVALGAYSHQDLPFQILVEKLQKERDPSHTPLFQAFFLLQNFEFPPLKLSGLTTAPVALDIGTAKVDLCLELYEQEDNSLTGWLEYNSALFSPARMQRMVGHLQTLLESIVTHPEQSIATLPLLTEIEKQQLLVEWQRPLILTLSSAERDNAREWENWSDADSIPKLFTAQAIRTPHAIAVLYGNQHLTYQQLNQRANQLAHYLHQLGVGPGVCVGLSLERSLEMVIGMLGILKAGGAYVPLDPHYPQEHLAIMVADAQIAVIVTHSTLRPQVPSQVQRVEIDSEEVTRYPQDNLRSGVTANQLAYITYTAGSTGVLKGERTEHGVLSSSCETVILVYGLTAEDRVLQLANLSLEAGGVDAAVEEIYPGLLTGATLVLRTPDMMASPSQFWQCCQAWGVTVLVLPKVLGQKLISDTQATTVLPGVRLVILGGEGKERILEGEGLEEGNIPELFTAQAIRTPQAIAVLYGNQHLTYQQLNQRANQLAHYLRQLGVGPEVCVGLSLERSLGMVIGLLGILKAGGAYVPLDPHYPQERLAMMVADAHISIVVTHPALSTQFPSQVQRVYLDREEIAHYPQDNLRSGVSANQLAYVIYTSGSTGTPKGVMLEHGALTSFCQTVIPIYGLTAQDRVLQFANLSFDAAVEEIYPCLLTGATLVLRTPEMIDSPAQFWQRCQAWGVTVLDLPTAYWHELVNDIQATTVPPGVRLVILGGEAAHANRLATWQRFVNPQVRLINTYGPTEATVVATLGEITTLAPQNSIPIGQVLPGTSAYVLDANLQLVPVGVPGELHLGGNRLARGYLNQPTLTAEKFIADPFSSKPPSRLYKTGDLVCYRASGQLEFLGRIDKQVKVRGFRIELGEIESCLNQHPKVAQSVLVLREDEVGNKRLVAYVVPRR